jgi:hypothetical protein
MRPKTKSQLKVCPISTVTWQHLLVRLCATWPDWNRPSPTHPTLLHSVLLIGLHVSFTTKCTDKFWTSGIARSVWRLATGWMAVVRFSAGAINCLHNVHTGTGAHPTSYPMGTGALSPGVKWSWREFDHSSLPTAEVKNGGAITSLPYTSSWHGT